MKVAATLDRLNAFGTIATISDALLAVRRIQEKKINEAFAGLFNDSGLEDLEIARKVLSDMFPKPVAPTYTLSDNVKVPPVVTYTPPPVTQANTPKGKKGRK